MTKVIDTSCNVTMPDIIAKSHDRFLDWFL